MIWILQNDNGSKIIYYILYLMFIEYAWNRENEYIAGNMKCYNEYDFQVPS